MDYVIVGGVGAPSKSVTTLMVPGRLLPRMNSLVNPEVGLLSKRLRHIPQTDVSPLQHEFSCEAAGVNTCHKPCHVHHICKVSLQCGLLDVYLGLNSH